MANIKARPTYHNAHGNLKTLEAAGKKNLMCRNGSMKQQMFWMGKFIDLFCLSGNKKIKFIANKNKLQINIWPVCFGYDMLIGRLNRFTINCHKRWKLVHNASSDATMSTLNRMSKKFKAIEKTKRDEKSNEKEIMHGSNDKEHKSSENRLMFIVIYCVSVKFMIRHYQ